MPNVLTPWALRAWVPITLLLFTRFRPTEAVTFSLLGGLMFLPEKFVFDGPGIPPLGKEAIAHLSVLIGCLLFARGRLLAARPGLGLEFLVLVLVAAGFVTALQNGEYLYFGPRQVRRLAPWDGVSMGIRDVIHYGIPFFLGRALFRTRKDLRFLILSLVGAGLVYSVFAVWEFRMSPHLHKLTYGFHPNPYRFVARAIGYRPMVFMSSGIAVGLFMGSTAFAAAALARARMTFFGVPGWIVALYLFAILLLCQSIASVIYGLVMLPLLLLLSTPNLARVCLMICVLTFSYPALRATEAFPTDALANAAFAFDPERGESLQFRFDNEEILLDRAREKILFGWGGGGRNRVFDVYDGDDESVTDGFWILILGSRGLVGWAVPFLLLLVPVIRTCLRVRRVPDGSDRTLLMGLCVLLSVRGLDMLPNAFYTSLALYLSGALHGLVPALIRASPKIAVPEEPGEPELPKRAPPRNTDLLTNSRGDPSRE